DDFRARPAGAGGHERLDHRDQLVAGEVGDGVRAGLEDEGGAIILEIDAGEHLAAVEAGGLDRGGVVGGEAVLDLPAAALEAATVHRGEHQLVLERPEHQQVLEDVGGAEHPVHARHGERFAHAVQQLGAAGHGLGPGSDAEGATGWVVGGDDHHGAVGVGDGAALAGRGEAGEASRILDADPRDLLVGGDEGGGRGGSGEGAHTCSAPATPRLRSAVSISSTVWPWLGSPPSISRSISSVVGIAVEHSRREVTMAPAALQRVRIVSRSCPASSPWHREPPKLSPAPRPLITWIRLGATTTCSSAVLPSTPLGPCLTIAIWTPASSSASAARSGSVSPTATSHSSLLPTATVVCF